MSTEPVPPPAPESDLPPSSPPPAGTAYRSEKKMVAGILAILLGAFGIHKFYLGYQKEGIIMAVVGGVGLFLCGFPTMATSIIGIIEGVMYLTKTDEEFDRIYVTGRKPWF
jgi:TM2 domain-containing membrane protein YozV